MYPHIISIFNQYDDENGDTHFNKVVISDVLFIRGDNTGRNKLDLTNADIITVYVNMNAVRDVEYIDGALYQSAGDKDRLFAFNKGDYIAFGDVGESDMNINEFKNNTGNIYEVTGVTDYRVGSLKSLIVSAK